MGEGDHCVAMVEWVRAVRRGFKWALSGRTLSTRFAGTFGTSNMPPACSRVPQPVKGKEEDNRAPPHKKRTGPFRSRFCLVWSCEDYW